MAETNVNILNVPVEEEKESQEYIEQMVNTARGNQQKAEEEAASDKEMLLAGKYKNEEALHKGIIELLKREHGDLESYYKQLESGLGKPKKQETPPTQQDPPKSEQQGQDVGQVGDVIDFDKLTEEYVQNNGFTEETYAAFEKRGIPRDVVDAYAAGQMALAQQIQQEVYNEVGGEQAYEQLLEWARANLTDDEKNTYDRIINSGDINEIKLAVNGLYAKYTSANGSPPKRLIHGAAPDVGGDVYLSRQELIADMSKPEYTNDPAFRAKVYAKLQRSNLFSSK